MSAAVADEMGGDDATAGDRGGGRDMHTMNADHGGRERGTGGQSLHCKHMAPGRCM